MESKPLVYLVMIMTSFQTRKKLTKNLTRDFELILL